MTKRTILIKQFRSARIAEISMTSVIGTQLEMADDTFEPSNVIQRKVEAIADVLGCTHEEAERIVLERERE